jgi:nitroreductase
MNCSIATTGCWLMVHPRRHPNRPSAAHCQKLLDDIKLFDVTDVATADYAQTDRSDLAGAMKQVLVERYSCRSYKSDPVPDEVLRAIFEQSQLTASWCNSQAWEVALVSGAAKRALTGALIEDVTTNRSGGSDIPPPGEYVGEYLRRRRASGFALYGALGISRDDAARRREQMLENYRFFGAPHVAIIHSPAELGPYGYIDCGGFVANVLNVAQSYGVATIAQAAVVLRPKAVRSVLAIPAERHLVCGISMGYAEPDHPANNFRTERAGFADTVTIFE